MGLVYTEEELKAAGYREIRPGVYARVKGQTEAPTPSKSKFKFVKAIVGGKSYRFRSSWEHTYALYLQLLLITGKIKGWKYEPQTFYFKGIKRGAVSYLPDFYVLELDGTHNWREVKGYLDARGATKLKRMKKYFPEEIITLVREEEIKQLRELHLDKRKDLL